MHYLQILGINASDTFSFERNAFPMSCFLMLIKCAAGNSLQTKERQRFFMYNSVSSAKLSEVDNDRNKFL